MVGKNPMNFRERLLQQRREIFNRLRRLENEWQELSEREIELEEEAQKSDFTSLYDRLDELETKEIEEIDLALYKITAGKYGTCESCHKAISSKRLAALPATRLCRKCAAKYEAQEKTLRSVQSLIRPAVLPPEYRNLDPAEIEKAVIDRLRADGRIDLDEFELSYRKGVLYLEGAVPSEKEHRIVLRILLDAMGFESIVDHLGIIEVAWEREDRTSGKNKFAESVDSDEIAEDIFESQEDELPYMYPDRPPPEKE
jgi:DnaK suppressor protein